jgi:hypothetical protein
MRIQPPLKKPRSDIRPVHFFQGGRIGEGKVEGYIVSARMRKRESPWDIMGKTIENAKGGR